VIEVKRTSRKEDCKGRREDFRRTSGRSTGAARLGSQSAFEAEEKGEESGKGRNPIYEEKL